MGHPVSPSQNQINMAGDKLRDVVRGELAVGDVELDRIIKVAQAWRATFATPLLKVRMGLESFVRPCDMRGDISQRHKRLATIAQKTRPVRQKQWQTHTR